MSKIYSNKVSCTLGKPLLRRYTEVAVFLLGFLALIVPSGYSVGAVLLVLGGLYVWSKDFKNKNTVELDRRDKWLLAILLFFSLEGVFNWLWHGLVSGVFDDSDLDKVIRFALAIPIFFLIYRARPSLHYLWTGIALGAIGACIFAIYQKFGLGLPRPNGHTNAIQFGNLSMLLGVFCLAGLGWASTLKKYKTFFFCLLVVGAFCGLNGSFLSGSRGGWIGLPFVFFFLYRVYRSFFSTKVKVIGLIVTCILAITAFNLPQLAIKDRVNEAFNELISYGAGNVNSSIGARLEMWKGTAILISEKPLMGWTKERYIQAKRELGEQGIIQGVAATQFSHAHNELLDRQVKHGLLGLLTLLALYAAPIIAFSAYLRHKDLAKRSLAVAGVLLPFVFIDFGLTQAFLRHNSGVMMYAAFLMVFAGYFKMVRTSVSTRL